MNLHRIAKYATLALAAFFASCADQQPEPVVNKTEPGYVNPFEPGTYEHFKAEKKYPKTHDVWRNSELLAKTNPSNSWIHINLASQRGRLMNGEQVVMDYPICSGTRSHPTPKGEFKILEKVVDKYSNKYGKIYDADDIVTNSDANAFEDPIPEGGRFQGASMRYWMRMTWTGVGHHVGPVRRYPASHACVRGPSATMPTVYSKVKLGTRIFVD